ncbi:TPA: hypothetical protein N0F65_011067 [Lagenidium giganteum]|uniref:Uncharacterized protein n=1 Tax=Lagenidium giganteum TaxID=4803 RepID=A0AAV2ZI73_9STRA|nr:TPA: hypothetical protein N0F65_011067 [Lagenidium giganteum]
MFPPATTGSRSARGGAAIARMAEAGSRLRGVRQKLNALRIQELRTILADLNLTRSGRKSEMIERIADALEQFERKALDNASNHATATFYTDQLNAGLRALDEQMQISRGAPRYAPPPPAPPASETAPVALHQRASPQVHVSPPAFVYRGAAARPNGVAGAPATGAPAYAARHNGVAQPIAIPNGVNAGPRGLLARPYASTLPTMSGGVELFKPCRASALELNGRCFCIPPAVSGKEIRCQACNLAVHAKCHQLIATPVDVDGKEWYCEHCRAHTYDPFLNVVRTLLAPQYVRFAKPLSTFQVEFTLSDRDLNDMYTKRGTTPGCWELQFRCFALKDELANGHCWPTTCQVHANGFNVPITQRAPPGHSNPSKVLREIPANVFPYARAGRNTIDIRTSENPTLFAIMLQVVEIRDIEELVQTVVENSAKITYEDAKQEVIKSFGGDDDDDDDGIVTMSTILSVRCPLGLCVINMPARGLHCKHLQCFDLRTFLQFNKSARSKPWRCTICHNFIKVPDLRIDPYFKKLLADVAGEEDLEEVEILPDASWRKKVGEDEVPSPPPKRQRIKEENGDAGSVVVTADAPAPAVAEASVSGSAAAPVEIDLSLTSDEEDGADDTPKTTAKTSSAIPTSSTTTTTPAQRTSVPSIPDLLGEVPVLTVDSDIWETAPSSSTTQIVNGALYGTAAGSGNSNGIFPFALDDNVFPPSGGASGSASQSGLWGSMYVNMPLPSDPTWPPGPILPPPVSAPLPTMPRSSQLSSQAPATSSRSASSSQDELRDVICLLDSDSE